MENNFKVSKLISSKEMAKSSIHYFHEFIHDMEPVDLDEDCSYSSIWFEMEIVYALILDEWEASGRKADLQGMFLGKFHKDVCEVVDAFAKYVISSNKY